jgi:hypothetical protein
LQIRGADFLFDGQTRDFIMKIRDMLIRSHVIEARLNRSPDDPEFEGLSRDAEEIIVQFLFEQEPQLEDMFSRYLDLSKIGL